MELNLYTWNTQGSLEEENKLETINGFFKASNTIAFIQEGGVDSEIEDYTMIFGTSVGLKNERCTNYIMTNIDENDQEDTSTYNVVAGGEAGRSPACANYEIDGFSLSFVSWHSSATKDMSATKALLSLIEEDKDCDFVIIGADFNNTPVDIADMIERQTVRTRANFKYNYYIVNSGHSTQKKGKELDFFIIAHKKTSRSLFCNTRCSIVRASSFYSDHDAVHTKVVIA